MNKKQIKFEYDSKLADEIVHLAKSNGYALRPFYEKLFTEGMKVLIRKYQKTKK